MIKLRHLRVSCGNLFCAFKLSKDDTTTWIVRRLDQHTKSYKCYAIGNPSLILYVYQECFVYEAEFE